MKTRIKEFASRLGWSAAGLCIVAAATMLIIVGVVGFGLLTGSKLRAVDVQGGVLHTLSVGESYAMELRYIPAPWATQKQAEREGRKRTVEWRSQDESVAVVDSNGVVTALAPGKATIQMSTDDFVSCTNIKFIVEP